MISVIKFILIICFLFIVSNSTTVSYGFNGIDSQEFNTIFHKFPISSLLKVLQSMDNHTQLLLRPFNFGSTKSYTDHTGLGKNTNVKGKSCYLNDETLNGKITYIQSNAYTGRNQNDAKITYIGKYLDRDRQALQALKNAVDNHCSQWKTKSVDEIKKDILSYLPTDQNDTILYINQRFMFKVNIQGTHYLTTEFVTTAQIESNSQLPVTEQHCSQGHCSYEVKDQKTNKVEVLAYETVNLDTCEFKEFQLVADMDILTIHFPYEDHETQIDLTKYFTDETGKMCEDSFKLAFGISPEESIVYQYVYKLIEATAEWGLIRHSIEALNFCFTQPYETDNKFYLKISKNIIGNGEITMIKQTKNSRIIPDTVRQWVLEGKCTPINPSWLYINEKQPNAIMWKDCQKDSILTSAQFLNNRCPTYDVIQMINQNGASIPIKSVKEKNLRTNSKHHRLQLLRK